MSSKIKIISSYQSFRNKEYAILYFRYNLRKEKYKDNTQDDNMIRVLIVSTKRVMIISKSWKFSSLNYKI